MNTLKRTLPLMVCFIVGLVFVVQYFVPHPPLNYVEQRFLEDVQIISAFAIFLGLLNLVLDQLFKLSKRGEPKLYPAVVLVSFFSITIIGLFDIGRPTGMGYEDIRTWFGWMFNNIYNPLSATMFALLAFYMASASYRAFRARSLEAALLLIAAFIVMLGRVPLGEALTGFMPEGYRIGNLADWIMNYPNLAGQRAILIGIALGSISVSLRLLLGIERSYLGGE